MSELSTRVRLRREELGLSQEQLAQRMGYRSKSSITKLEKGVNDIPQAKLEELAAALETTPAYLLGLDVLCPPPGFEPLPIMRKELTIVGAKGPFPNLNSDGSSMAMDMLMKIQKDVRKIIQVYDYTDALRAFEDMMCSRSIKSVITFH